MRQLAHTRGQSFTYPHTRAQAAAEIRAAPAQDDGERELKLRWLDSTPVPADATRVRLDEVVGRGGHAHWADHREDRS